MAIVPYPTGKGGWRFRDSDTGKWVDNPGIDMSKIEYTMTDIQGDQGSSGFQYSSTGYAHLSEVYKGLFKPTITDETLEDMFNRDELAHAGIMDVSRNLFDKWVEIHAFFKNGKRHETLEQEIVEFNDTWDIKDIFRRAWLPKQVLGVSLIGLGLPGIDLAQEATSGPISYISAIPKSRISRLIVDLRPDSPRYGEIWFAEIYSSQSESDMPSKISEGQVAVENLVLVHHSRFIHWHYPRLEDTDPFGLPGWLPLADVLTVKKNIDYAIGEALWQFATRKYILIASPFTSKADWDKIALDWKNFRSTTNFAVKGDNIRVEEFGGEGQLDPTPYTDWFSQNIGPQLGISKTHLVQTERGGSASVEARRNFERKIASIQRSDVEKVLKQFYTRMMDLGILSRGRLEFHWHALTELSEEEQAFIQSRHGLGRNLEMRAVETAIGAGLSVELDDDGHVVRFFVDGSGEDFDEHILHPPEEPVEKPGEKPGEMPPEEKAELEEMIKELVDEGIKKKIED